METLGRIVSQVKIDDIKFTWEFHIVNDGDILSQSILGNDILQKVDINISHNNAKFLLKEVQEPHEDILFDMLLGTKPETPKDPFIANELYEKICFEGIFEIENEKNTDVLPEYKNQLIALIENYQPNKVKESEIKLNIILNDEKPVYQQARQLPFSDQKLVEEQMEKWLEEGIIRISNSSFASPIVLVKKKDGTKRICVDYRKVNEKMVKDNFPMVLIDNVLAKLQKAKIFTTLDLKNGFFHVPVEENSQKYTSFITHQGQYEFLRTPFGMKNSPAIFCRFITNILHKLIQNDTMIVYMDDIVIPSKTEEENLEKLKQVLNIASSYGLNINWKKCQFLKKEICFLGYHIQNATIKPSIEKTKAVINYKIPNNTKSLQRFLGLTSYFRRFIENYAVKAKPLTDMLAKDAKVIFKEKQCLAFQELKQALSNAPVLRIYDPEAETEVHADASSFGFGAVLLQKSSEDQKFHPVEYMSRKTSVAESKYSSYELEVLAIIEALKKWRIYLLGIKFKLITDCHAFTQTVKKTEVPNRIARWVMFLQDYEFEIEHRAGSKIKHVDALSRTHTLMIQSALTHSIIEAQKEDEWTATIRGILEKRNYKDFYIRNNILYKEKDKIVVPEPMQREVIQIAHNQGHFGIKKTTELIEKDFFMRNLQDRVENYVKNCIQCILVNQKQGKKEGLLNPIDKSNRPLQTFHLDHLGPMEPTKKQYNHILTVVDAFTKFTWIFPTKSTTSEEVVDRMLKITAVFGNPERIITDRGTAFTAKCFKEYCEENNIEHQLITTGVPRANGQVERVHKVIISILSKLCLGNEANWYKHTDKIQQYINNTPPRSTKVAPFKILTGLDMKIPNNLNFNEMIEDEIIQEMNKEKDEIRMVARENINKIQAENINTFNKKRVVETKYHINDLVAIKRTQFGTGLKLKPKFLGPYKVVEEKRNGRYEVEKVGTNEGPIRTSTIAEYMKMWHDSGSNQ